MSAIENEAQAAFDTVMQAAKMTDNTLPPANESEELQREIDALAAMPLLTYEREYNR